MNIHITRYQNGDYIAKVDEESIEPVTFIFANKSKVLLTKRWLERLAQLMYNWQQNPNQSIRRMSQILWAHEGSAIRDSNANKIAMIMEDDGMRFMPEEKECPSNASWELLYKQVHIIDSFYNFIIQLKEQDLDTTKHSFDFVVEKQFTIADKLCALNKNYLRKHT